MDIHTCTQSCPLVIESLGTHADTRFGEPPSKVVTVVEPSVEPIITQGYLSGSWSPHVLHHSEVMS